MKSSLGSQLQRAEIFGTGSNGEPIRPRKRPKKPQEDDPALQEVPCRESRHWAPTVAADGYEQRELLDRALERLTPEEREVIELQERPRTYEEVTITVAAGELKRYYARGYRFVRSLPLEQRADGTLVQYTEICGLEGVHLSYEEIGERLGLSARQVHRRISSARRKLRAA